MNYENLPTSNPWRAWKTADGNWEVKFENEFGDLVLHLTEDDKSKERIEDEKFYVNIEGGEASGLKWIREREGIRMPDGIIDADYISFRKDGSRREYQHNHVHLDNDVRSGRLVALTPA